MMALVDSLKDLEVASVVPMITEVCPTLLIGPANGDNHEAVRNLCRELSKRAQQHGTAIWSKHAMNDEWLLRLHTEAGINVDILTRLPAKVEAEFNL